jgi:hypothetical protein
MPSLYWAILAGVGLLGGAAVLNGVLGRDLARTRDTIFAVQRLSKGLRRLNEAAVGNAQKTVGKTPRTEQPEIVPRSAGRRRPMRTAE